MMQLHPCSVDIVIETQEGRGHPAFRLPGCQEKEAAPEPMLVHDADLERGSRKADELSSCRVLH